MRTDATSFIAGQSLTPGHLQRLGIASRQILCLLGLMLRWHQVPPHDIARLRVVESYTVESNSKRDVYYRITAELRGGRQLTIAQDLKGRAQADKLLASIGGWTGYATR